MAVDEAIVKVPAPWRRRLLVTSAGASHEFIGWLAELNTAARALAAGELPTLFTADGYKFSGFAAAAAATAGLSTQPLAARHRCHARVEDQARTTRDIGLGHLPSKSWNVNLG
jgi:hypothetical protein